MDGRVRVKICGITRAEDARLAERAGADAIGLIFAERSKRRVSLAAAAGIVQALGPFITRVGVFVDAPLDQVRAAVHRLKLGAVQLHGDEPAAYAAALRGEVMVVRAVAFEPNLTPAALEDYPADAFLLDAPTPGSGTRFEWSQAADWRAHPRLVLAGGLTPETVAEGVRALRPYAVDVASGVESEPGIKDGERVQAFVRAVREA
ncbi:MAG: phosphoribosylanthranilate isomerase [Deinococcales bacterium]